MALYREYNPIIDRTPEELIFEDNIYNEDISLKQVANIEKYYKENNYIREEDLEPLLNYISAYSRLSVCREGTPLASSMAGYCYNSALVNYELLTKMGFKAKAFNISKIVGAENQMHELCIVNIPVLINNEVVDKEIVLDPTFKQFCLKEGCRKERYNEEKRYGIRKATPMPGYFLSLTDDGMNLAKNINRFGYFEKTDANFKMYCDSFKLFTMEKEDYNDPSLVGKISSLDTDINAYNDNLNECKNDGEMGFNNIVRIKTPLEVYSEYERKSKLRILKGLKEKYLENNTNNMIKPEFDIKTR